MRAVVIALGLIFLMVSISFAGPNADAKVIVHVLPHTSRSCTKNFPTISGCQEIITSTDEVSVDFFPVFFDIAASETDSIGYQGLEYGVMWEGSSCTFTSCSDFTIGGIYYPGDGISHAWSHCQPYSVAIPGFGWVFSYDRICIIPHPEMGGPNIGDCQVPDPIIDSLPPENIGCAGTNGVQGDDPCGLSVRPTTWGEIKGMFR